MISFVAGDTAVIEHFMTTDNLVGTTHHHKSASKGFTPSVLKLLNSCQEKLPETLLTWK